MPTTKSADSYEEQNLIQLRKDMEAGAQKLNEDYAKGLPIHHDRMERVGKDDKASVQPGRVYVLDEMSGNRQ